MQRERRTIDLLHQECVKSYPSGLIVNTSSQAGNLLAGNWEKKIWDRKTSAQGPEVEVGSLWAYIAQLLTNSETETQEVKWLTQSDKATSFQGWTWLRFPDLQANACLALLPLSPITNKGDQKSYGSEFLWYLYSTFITSEWCFPFLFFFCTSNFSGFLSM